jgi:large subunit ribosomal protein L18
MNKQKQKFVSRISRHKRLRAKVSGTSDCPRIAVFKSNQFTSVQVVDDVARKTLFSLSTKDIKGKKNKTEKAIQMGEALADKIKEKGIEKVVFDRGGFKYHGRVKGVADGLRKSGLKF